VAVYIEIILGEFFFYIEVIPVLFGVCAYLKTVKETQDSR